MRFLVDQPLSWRLARLLRDAGHDAVHVQDRGVKQAPDPVVFATASSEKRVIVTQDIDFETLLLASGRPTPSVVLFRIQDGRTSTRAKLLLDNLPQIQSDLEAGAIVTFEEQAIRVHRTQPISLPHPRSPAPEPPNPTTQP